MIRKTPRKHYLARLFVDNEDYCLVFISAVVCIKSIVVLLPQVPGFVISCSHCCLCSRLLCHVQQIWEVQRTDFAYSLQEALHTGTDPKLMVLLSLLGKKR